MTETDIDPLTVIEAASPKSRRGDALRLLDLFGEVTGWPPRVWGDAIIGYGAYDYAYRSGRTGRWFRTGFAPRKANMAVYLMPGVAVYPELLARLGPHRHSVSCLYFTRLDQIDSGVLRELVAASLQDMARIYGPQV